MRRQPDLTAVERAVRPLPGAEQRAAGAPDSIDSADELQ
jgi:hypothetical protein